MTNGADTPKTQEEIDKEERKKKGLTAGGFLSLLPSIAGAIPGLLPSKQRGALKDMQAGRGAGAQAARAAASEAGRRTAGNLGGRGSSGQVRAGIASAERQTAIGAREAGRIGQQEGITGTSLLLAEEQKRRGLGLKLGAGLGGAFSGALGLQTAALDQGPGKEVTGALTQAPSDGTITPEDTADLHQQEFIRQAQEGLSGLQSTRQAALPAGPTQGGQAAPSTRAPDPSVLGAIVAPETRFEQAKQSYMAAVGRPSEAPFISSSGGTDTKVKEEQALRQFALELAELVASGEIKQEEMDEELRRVRGGR